MSVRSVAQRRYFRSRSIRCRKAWGCPEARQPDLSRNGESAGRRPMFNSGVQALASQFKQLAILLGALALLSGESPVNPEFQGDWNRAGAAAHDET